VWRPAISPRELFGPDLSSESPAGSRAPRGSRGRVRSCLSVRQDLRTWPQRLVSAGNGSGPPKPSNWGSLCPASYHNTAQLLPSDSRMFSLEIPLDLASGEYGDVYFGLLPKTRKHLNGPPLSTRASLHARPWSEVDREARQISCPSKQREALAPTKNCVSAASLMNSRRFIIR
jgi:hypothetical protein